MVLPADLSSAVAQSIQFQSQSAISSGNGASAMSNQELTAMLLHQTQLVAQLVSFINQPQVQAQPQSQPRSP